jgi:hypothetical protein
MSHILCSPVRWQRAETILGTPSPCLKSALRQSKHPRSSRSRPSFPRPDAPDVRCDLAHVCQLVASPSDWVRQSTSASWRRGTAFDARTQPLAACELGDSARVFGDALDECFRAKKDVAMTGNFDPPEVTIRSYQDSPICDVVVVVRGRKWFSAAVTIARRCDGRAWNVRPTKFLSPMPTLQPKLNPATRPFSCVQIEIDLCSARNVRKTGG